MSALPASAPPAEAAGSGGTVWCRGMNWLGDSVMTLPALAAYRRTSPGVRLVMAARPGLVPFWSLCPLVDAVQPLPPGLRGDGSVARALRRLGARRAIVFPNSFRSAWVPFLAHVPERVGFPGSGRRFLLTRSVHPVSYTGSRHQALDYFALVGAAPAAVPPVLDGLLAIPAAVRDALRTRLRAAAAGTPGFPAEGPWMAVAPGAARGSSKRWPASHFAAAAAAVFRARGCGVIVCGTGAEREAGDAIAASVPGGTINLAGATTLPELAALFQLCRLVLCNDSGAMHLAAAVSTPVVALFGLTDPGRTGPLGRGHAVLAPDGVRGHAAIGRESAAAAQALAAIRPERAAAEAIRLLDRGSDA